MYIMEVSMKVAKWGNSLAVRLPASVVESLQLQEGDEVDLHREADGAFSVELQATRREIIDRAIERLRAYRGSLPADYKFDRDEANER
jgi:antitoxin MazE